ncbi:uncharacterized protein LOC128555743 [Mercenaria mercenaria]|uniref:uncharacterized protein LOC128555743 n=1 Tax=Mercenaria mercenaria TaxID=6596 RepID=UPI00234F5A9B|nr:uncharacterized protein LOC128555743 [Mercenaria mercenaria]
MDSSASIQWRPFKDAKIQTSKLIGLLCPSDKPSDKVAGQPYQYNQAAMLTYSQMVEETVDFKRYNTTSDIQNAISRATHFARSTNTAEAFRRAKGLFTTAKSARDPARAKREVLILTDGQSDNAAETLAEAESLKHVAEVYGLITGSFLSDGMKELTKYVSAPINEYLFYVQDYQVLGKLVAYIQDSKKILGPK